MLLGCKLGHKHDALHRGRRVGSRRRGKGGTSEPRFSHALFPRRCSVCFVSAKQPGAMQLPEDLAAKVQAAMGNRSISVQSFEERFPGARPGPLPTPPPPEKLAHTLLTVIVLPQSPLGSPVSADMSSQVVSCQHPHCCPTGQVTVSGGDRSE